MRNILITFFSISLVLPNVPKTLKGQRNKTKVTPHNRFIKIEKANVSYIFGPQGDRVVSTNFGRRSNLISKTNYKINDNENIFLIQDDCLKIDCHYFIHE